MPALSVLVPVRDAAPWIHASLRSLWRQTFSDFEVIAVDDGSRDGTGVWLDRAARAERRLRVIHTEARGLPAALGTALAHARAPLVARHDADDLSHRARFAAQAAFLAAHPHVSVAGTRVRLFPTAGTGMRRWVAWHNGLLTHEQMAREVLIDSPLAHGTAMMRRSVLETAGGWRERGWAEDVDLWVRLFGAKVRFAKLPQALYAWRQHPASATRRDPRYRREQFIALRVAALEAGLLRRAPRLTLIGVGKSLAEWGEALAASGRQVMVRETGRPTRSALANLVAPIVLVFGAGSSRDRWRQALAAMPLMELTEFVFVA